MRKQVTLFAVLVTTLFGSSRAFADGERIAIFTKNANVVFEEIRVGATYAAKSMNVNFKHYVPTVPDSIAEQTSEVEDAIQTKPDGIVLYPVDHSALAQAVVKANAANIPVVLAADRVDTGKYVTFVGVDDDTMGLNIGRYLLKSIGGKGNVIILEGAKASSGAQGRLRGFKKALEEFPDVKVLASQTANWQRLEGLQVMENLLQRFPKIDGILAANDPMALGALEALKSAGRTAAIVGMNGSTEAAAEIRKGTLLASTDYRPFAMGCASAMAIIRNIRHLSVPENLVISDVVMDKSNVDQLSIPLAERVCPKWEDMVQ